MFGSLLDRWLGGLEETKLGGLLLKKTLEEELDRLEGNRLGDRLELGLLKAFGEGVFKLEWLGVVLLFVEMMDPASEDRSWGGTGGPAGFLMLLLLWLLLLSFIWLLEILLGGKPVSWLGWKVKPVW